MCSAAWARRAGRAGRRTGAAAARCRPAAPSCAAAAAAISAVASQVSPRAAPPSSFPFHAAPLRGAAWRTRSGGCPMRAGHLWMARTQYTHASMVRQSPAPPAAAPCSGASSSSSVRSAPRMPANRVRAVRAKPRALSGCRGSAVQVRQAAGRAELCWGAAVSDADVRRAALRALARRCRLGGGIRKNMFMITTPGWSWVSSLPEHACSTACSTQATPSRGRRRRCRAEPPRAARRPGAHWRRPAACRRPRSARA